MSTAIEKASSTTPDGERVFLQGVRYRDYVALRDEPKNDHLKMTYYNGTLEIMSPDSVHERPSRRIGVFLSVVCEELDVEFEGLRSTTFRKGQGRLKKGHGKEPDECFYFANAPRILGKNKIDLDVDPAPDLWLEVDNRSSSRGKLPVYAALGVPEVWRYRTASGRLRFGRLAEDGTGYEPIERSLSLPMLTPALVLEALSLGEGVLEKTWTKSLRAWVREIFGTRADEAR